MKFVGNVTCPSPSIIVGINVLEYLVKHMLPFRLQCNSTVFKANIVGSIAYLIASMEVVHNDTIKIRDMITLQWEGNWTVYNDIESGYPIPLRSQIPKISNILTMKLKRDG